MSTGAAETSSPPATDGRERFVQRLTGAQSHLYAFICSLLGGTRDARDVLQETNAVLWKKAGEYDASRDFLVWAHTFARLQVMAYRKRVSRDRLVLDDELIRTVASAAAARNVDIEERLRTLDGCIAKLPPSQQTIVRRRYVDGAAVTSIATEVGKTAATVAVLLHRIRLALGRCIREASGGVA